MELIWNEETQCFEQHKKPYATIEVETKEDFDEIMAALEFYRKYKEEF